MILFQYRSLRDKLIFVIWFTLSMLMFGMFFWFSGDSTLNINDEHLLAPNHYANGLKVPLLLLVEFWIFSKVSKKLYGTKLLMPSKSFNRYDYEEGRHFNLGDTWWMIVSVVTIYLGHFR